MSAGHDVWSALANPVRRSVLDELQTGPRTTGELVAAFPHLSRFAVMQHLGVLEEAGLLLVRRQGRQRLNHVNPAPLEEVRQRWMSTLSESAARSALALKRHVERSEEEQVEATAGVARAVRIESELRVQARRARVFEALTEEQHRWYPYTYGMDRCRDIVFEPKVGGQVYEDWGDGAGHWYGTVTHFDPPSAVTTRGWLGGGTVLENAFELEEDGDGATVIRHHMAAFGDLTDDDVQGIRTHGDMSVFEPQLRAWVEQGTSVR